MALHWTRKHLWLLLVLGFGGALVYGLLVGKPEPQPEPLPEPVVPTVDIVLAHPQAQALMVESQGTVQPQTQIKLVSRVSGRVEAVAAGFAVGGFFSAGEQLVKVEHVDYQFAIARAQSQLAGARQRLAEEEGRALQAKREWRDLGTKTANALFLREPQIASAQAALKASEADLAAAELDLARTSITAPFNGRVSEKLVDQGQFVSPGNAIAAVYSTEVVEVRLPLTGRQVALLDLPLVMADVANPLVRAEVTLRAQFANQDWEWSGHIVRTDASIDESSRVVYAVAEVVDPFAPQSNTQRPPLAPGLFVHATISGKELPDVTQLPRGALRSNASVMIVDGDGRLLVRKVAVLQTNARAVWVQGLAQDERVVISDSSALIAGTLVSVNPADDSTSTLKGEE